MATKSYTIRAMPIEALRTLRHLAADEDSSIRDVLLRAIDCYRDTKLSRHTDSNVSSATVATCNRVNPDTALTPAQSTDTDIPATPSTDQDDGRKG